MRQGFANSKYLTIFVKIVVDNIHLKISCFDKVIQICTWNCKVGAFNLNVSSDIVLAWLCLKLFDRDPMDFLSINLEESEKSFFSTTMIRITAQYYKMKVRSEISIRFIETLHFLL